MKFKTVPTVEHAGTGYRMPEDMARRIDTLSHGLPAECHYRRKAIDPSSLSVAPGERTDVSTITTDQRDRDKEVVLPSGGNWDKYNRVVPLAHDYKSLPVGSNWWIRPQGDTALIAKTHYPAKPDDWGDSPWLPSAILHLMQQPVPTCTGKSIGFQPLKIRAATSQEIATHPDWSGCPVIESWIGIEYSVAPVPANPGAEMIQVAAKAVKALGPAEREIILAAYKAGGVNLDTDTTMDLNQIAQKIAADVRLKAGGPMAHLDFVPPPNVQQVMKKGVEQHEAMGHDCATPEQLAMAAHMGNGGKCSPEYAMSMKDWHTGVGANAASQPDGTPMHTLSMLHGGVEGKAWVKTLCKGIEQSMGGKLNTSPSINASQDNSTPMTQPAMSPPDVAGTNPPSSTDLAMKVNDLLGQLNAAVKGMTGISEFSPDAEAGRLTAELPDHIKDAHQGIAGKVPQPDCAKDGRVDEPQGVIMTGLKCKAADLAKCLNGQAPVIAKCGKTATVPTGDGRDLIHVPLGGSDMDGLRQKLMSLQHLDSNATPHIPVVYTHDGKGEQYKDMDDMDGMSCAMDSLDFTDEDGDKCKCYLTGKAVKIVKPEQKTTTESGNGGMLVDSMPECPNCGTNEGVTTKDEADDGLDTACMKGAYVCNQCGKDFDVAKKDEEDGDEDDEEKSIESRVSIIRKAIESGINDGPWSYSAADRAKSNPSDFIGDGKYPVMKGGTVYLRGLKAAASRAATCGETAISEAAGKLVAEIESKINADKLSKALEATGMSAEEYAAKRRAELVEATEQAIMKRLNRAFGKK